VHRASTANCSNWASTSGRAVSANIWCAAANRRLRLGRTFLENHAQQLVSIDFFTVPTIRFQVLYVFLVLAHDRRRILHFNVTAHPTADWNRTATARGNFPLPNSPRYLLRDRDAIFGDDFREHVRDMGNLRSPVLPPALALGSEPTSSG